MMITEFQHCEKESSACGVKSNSLHSPGSSGSGPWVLRPKRLQWLTNISSGFKIAAPASGFRPLFFYSKILQRLKAVNRHSPPFFFERRAMR